MTIWANWAAQGNTNAEAALTEAMTDSDEFAYVITGKAPTDAEYMAAYEAHQAAQAQALLKRIKR